MNHSSVEQKKSKFSLTESIKNVFLWCQMYEYKSLARFIERISTNFQIVA